MMSQFEPKEIDFERERVVLEQIQKNPNLHHNALIRLIVPKHMAKTTFERIRNNLIEKNIINFTTKGNRKFYQITENYEQKSIHLIERITISNFQHLKNKIKKFDGNFHHRDVNEKILSASDILRKLFQTDNGLTLLDSIKNSKKTLYKDEHLEIQEMISCIFRYITKEDDSKIMLPTVINSVGVDLLKNFDQN